jgi:hypothetical protein
MEVQITRHDQGNFKNNKGGRLEPPDIIAFYEANSIKIDWF